MEMTLTVHLPRRRPHPVDVLVRWSGRHTAADLCARLADHLAEPVDHLSSRGRTIPADAVVGEPPLLHGSAVAVGACGPDPPAVTTGAGLLEVVVVGGPDAGHAHALTPPAVLVGRAPESGLVVADDSLSRVHASFRAGEGGVLVVDEGSTNGLVVDGRPTRGPVPVDASSVVIMGSSTVRLRRAPGPGSPVVARGDGRLTLPPPRASSTVDAVVEVACPAPPPERHGARVPWVAALVPVPVGVGLAFFLGPQLLAFALLGPVMLLAGALGDRWGAGRTRRRDAIAHDAAMRHARARLDNALTDERTRLGRAHPDPHAVLVSAEHRMPGLWCGGPLVPLRLGLGAVPTRVAWVADGSRTHPVVPRTPVVLSLADAECLGVVGPPSMTDAVVRTLIGQLCATQAPTRVGVAVATGDGADWRWCERLPHGIRPPSSEDAGASPARVGPSVARVLVVPAVGAPSAREVVATARATGWLSVVAAPDRASLPDGCGAVLTVGPGGGHSLETVSGAPVELVADGVGEWWADRLSRALAPLRCDVPTRGPAAGPPSILDVVSIDDVLPSGRTSPAALAQGWVSATARGGGLAAPVAHVGMGADGVHTLDLVRDGPHVLVGGTTGSGKSEFLRTLVTSLCVSSSPRDLTLVLVDFKGGAAFGPCAHLPHVVGLVTDLDDHLATRALVSLRAELRRRESLLVGAGVQDLEAYCRSPHGRAHPLPRLVVVVDELRTLVDEVPEFVSGLVRLAAQGRSLGIHLVLATQRPAGAVSAEVQANVSLRIAFRVRDRSDSVTVVEDAAAADIPPQTPGRAVARGADGRLVHFQSAILGAPPARERPDLLEVLRVDGGARSVGGGPGPRHDDRRRDRSRRTTGLVSAIAAAHQLTGSAAPRRPWLPPLSDHLTLDEVRALAPAGSRADASAPLGMVDEPDLQRVRPLSWRPDDGTWLFSGRPRSGRTCALRALVASAAALHGVSALHVHLLDPTSCLGDLAALPHVGTHVAGSDRRALVALIRHLEDVVAARRADRSPAGAGEDAERPAVLVVVDGWEQLLEAHPETVVPGVAEDLVRVLRDGSAVGVVGAVAGGRALLHPRWAGLGASTIVLGPLDPLDAALAGLRAADVPKDPPPGRGIRLQDRREVQLALTRAADVRAGAPTAQPPVGRPWRHRPLPALVELPPAPPSHAIGVFGESHETWSWLPETHGRVLLVAGPVRSGRTNAVRVLATTLAAGGRSVVLVSRSSAAEPRTVGAGALEATALGGRGTVRVITPEDVEALVAARHRDPRLAALVDDADLLDDAPVGGVLHELLELVDRDDGLLVAVATSTTLPARFRGLDVAVSRRRVGLLLQPAAADGDLLGAPRVHGIPAVPGRGVFVSGGSATEVQVYLAPTSARGTSAVGADARDSVVGRGDPQG